MTFCTAVEFILTNPEHDHLITWWMDCVLLLTNLVPMLFIAVHVNDS